MSYVNLLAKERLVLEATEELVAWMQDHDITRAELARRMGVSKSSITQLLDGRNMTLGMFAQVVAEMGGRARIRIEAES